MQPSTRRGVSALLCQGTKEGRPALAKVRVGSIVLRVENLQRQIEFWAAALDYIPREGDSEDFVLLHPKDEMGPTSPSTGVTQPRVSLHVFTSISTQDQAKEVRRLIALGATEVYWNKRPLKADYVILADPEGNRFCVADVSRH